MNMTDDKLMLVISVGLLGASLVGSVLAVRFAHWQEKRLQMNAEEEKALRAKIAYDIRAELVCCDMYDTVQKVSKILADKGKQMWEPRDHIRDYHDICHWGECAAKIAEGGNDLPTAEQIHKALINLTECQMADEFCMCAKFKLWYIDEDTGIRVCHCGHPSSEHLDDTRMCVGDVTTSGS